MNLSLKTNNKKFERIFYGENKNQFGDLRLPNGDGPFPVAIVIHGGFWKVEFDLEQMNAFAESLTSNGIATWNIEYRRVGEEGGGWPGTFIDNAQATDFVRTLAESYPLDINRVATIGHSAGGHLALWIAARHKLPVDSVLNTTVNPLPIKGVISLSGVNDPILMHNIHQWKETLYGIVDNPTRDFMGGLPNDLPIRYKEGSPRSLLPIGVPLILIHGSLDVNVPIGITEHFEKAAKSAGDTVVLKKLQYAEHFELIVPESTVWPEILESTLQLLRDKKEGCRR